jgi:hypothetical protein
LAFSLLLYDYYKFRVSLFDYAKYYKISLFSTLDKTIVFSTRCRAFCGQLRSKSFLRVTCTLHEIQGETAGLGQSYLDISRPLFINVFIFSFALIFLGNNFI